MAVYLPSPRDDQAMFSLVVDYALGMKVGDWTALIQTLFGYRASLSPFFPYNIQNFADQTSDALGLTGLEALGKLTLAPYVFAYATECQRQIIADLILHRDAGRKPVFLMHAVSRRKTLAYCPECVRDDILKWGGPYWRRRHQIPAVLFCDVHWVRLSEMSYSRALTTPWPAPPRVQMRSAVVPVAESNSEIWRKVTSLSFQMLAAGDQWMGDDALPVTRERQFECIRDSGFGIGRGRVKADSLRRHFISVFGEATLAELGLLPTESGNWLAERLAGRQIGLSPLAETLISVFCSTLARGAQHAWPTCINKYACHGTEHPVEERAMRAGRYFATCQCGVSFSYATTVRGLPTDVQVSVYGPEYESAAQLEFQRGKSVAAIARQMGIAETNIRRWVKANRSAFRLPLSSAGRAFLEDQWKTLCAYAGGEGAASRVSHALWRQVRLAAG